MAKAICWIQHTQKRVEAKKNGVKDGKGLCKLINKALYKKSNGKLKK